MKVEDEIKFLFKERFNRIQLQYLKQLVKPTEHLTEKEQLKAINDFIDLLLKEYEL